MRHIIQYARYGSSAESFRLILLGDIHLGNRRCDEKTLKMLAQRIATEPNTYWAGLGDYCEFINMRDPRFDPEELPVWLFGAAELSDIAKAEVGRFLEIMQPTRDKCLGMCSGNHEDMILQHSEHDVYSMILDGLYSQGREHRLDHRGFISWRFGHNSEPKHGATETFRLFLTHGSGGGRKAGATANRLEDLAAQVDGADVVASGHTHRAQHMSSVVWRAGARGGVVHRDLIHLVSIPSLCADMQYAERRDMATLATGWVELEFTPATRTIRVQTNLTGG